MGRSKSRQQSISIRGENVIGTINASGNARLKVDQKVIHQATPELDRLFKALDKKIQARPADPGLDKADLQKQVKKIEVESSKGNKADPAKLEGWMTKLAKMAPDIFDVILASLGGPVSGFTAVFKKIAERAKQTSAA